MGGNQINDLRAWLLEQWCKHLALTLETMTGEAPVVSPSLQPAAAITGVKGWSQPLNLTPSCRVWVGCPEPVWKAIGYRVLTTAGLDSAVPEDQWESSLEIVRQTLSGTVQSIQSVIHKDLGCEAGEESDSYPTGTVQSCTLRFGDDAPLELYVVFEDQLVTAVDGLRQQPRKPATAQPMDLLYDVQLPVSISFGRTHLPLKEVIKLTSGSIVELNRAISEPVEVIVNNCVIARGEVVVIDGNYGIRINQIINRSERLRTLN